MRLHLPLGRYWRGAINGLVAATVAWLLVHVSLVQGLEKWMFDGCFQFRGRRPTASNVVLIGIDDNDLDDLREPIVFISPRLAKAVRYVRRQGAAAIGIDLVEGHRVRYAPSMSVLHLQGEWARKRGRLRPLVRPGPRDQGLYGRVLSGPDARPIGGGRVAGCQTGIDPRGETAPVLGAVRPDR